jgi:hypothetical protein
VETTNQPEHQDDDEHEAQYAAKPGAAIAAIAKTAAAKQQQKDHDNQNSAHVLSPQIDGGAAVPIASKLGAEAIAASVVFNFDLHELNQFVLLTIV